MRPAIDAYIAAEVLPHVPDAWVDYTKTKMGYEIPITRHFYVYKPPRPLAEIETDIATLEGEIAGLLKGLVGELFDGATIFLIWCSAAAYGKRNDLGPTARFRQEGPTSRPIARAQSLMFRTGKMLLGGRDSPALPSATYLARQTYEMGVV